jgi:hypothetical protein
MLEINLKGERWVGSDISLEHCLWVVESDETIWVLIESYEDSEVVGRWYRAGFDASGDSIEDWEEIVGRANICSFCDIYEEIPNLLEIEPNRVEMSTPRFDDFTESAIHKIGTLVGYDNGVEVYEPKQQGMSWQDFAVMLGEDPADVEDM